MADRLHKEIDYTLPGGYPLSQDRLEDIQSAYREAAFAIIAAGGSLAGPMVVSGMVVSAPTPGDVAVSNGFFVYDGRLIKFTGSTVTPGGGDVAMVLITHGTSNLVYNDGVSRPAKLSHTGTLTTGSSPDSTHIPVSELKPWGRELEWQDEELSDVGVPSVEGNIYYKKDFLTNTLLIRGLVYAATSDACDPMPNPVYHEVMTLAAGYRPNVSTKFIAHFKDVLATGYFLESSENDYIRHLNCRIDTDGKVYIEWLPSDGTAVAGYWAEFAVRVSLD